MTIMNQQITTQRKGSVIVHAACAICNVSENNSQGSRKSALRSSNRVTEYHKFAYRSIKSAIIQANIWRPSGICIPTIVTLFFRM